MDIVNHLFPDVFEWKEKHVHFPPHISITPDTILEILHNHRLLVQRILWPHFPILSSKYIKHEPLTTVFVIEQSLMFSRGQRKLTFTSLDDGVSCLEELLGDQYHIRWKVTPVTATYDQGGDDIGHPAVKERAPPATKCFLTESLTTTGIRIAKLADRFEKNYDPRTMRLIYFLAEIVGGRVSMSDVSEGRIQLATTAHRRLVAAKLKND